MLWLWLCTAAHAGAAPSWSWTRATAQALPCSESRGPENAFAVGIILLLMDVAIPDLPCAQTRGCLCHSCCVHPCTSASPGTPSVYTDTMAAPLGDTSWYQSLVLL